MEQIIAEWIRTIYQDDEYAVSIFSSPQGNVTCRGNNLPNKAGSQYVLSGEWAVSPKYGKQFVVSSSDWVKPKNQDGIIKYLSSGLLPGIGMKTAANIYQMFGEKTMAVLENEPHQLIKVKGVSKRKLPGIISAYEETKGMQEIYSFFSKYKISNRACANIYKNLGTNALKVLQQDPFLLCEQGVPFSVANRISLGENFGVHSCSRMEYAIRHVLNELMAAQGHLYVESKLLIDETLKTLNALANDEQKVGEKTLRAYANDLIRIKKIAAEKKNGKYRIYSYKQWEQENKTAEIIARRLQSRETAIDVKKMMETAEERIGMVLNEDQQRAVITALLEPITIITGGAGTGKTTILKAICAVCDQQNNISYALVSPTGRAARRMAEVTDRPASTIHSYFGLGVDDNGFFEPQNVHEDILVIDEFSMCDANLFHVILTHIKPNTKLILIGDHHQLPSVGAGNVLFDLISSKVVPVVYLKEIYRQDENSKIIKNSIMANNGISNFDFDESFQLVETNSAEQARDEIVRLYKQEANFLGNIDQVQVLSPYREKGAASALEINKAIQAQMNPGQDGITVNGVLLSVNDKVIQQRNTEKAKNGDIGYVKRLVDVDGTQMLEIVFDSTEVLYSKADLITNKVTLAFCVTVHKAQGSEYETVIMPVIREHSYMLRRNLFYTGITRAKAKMILVGQKAMIKSAVSNVRIENRNTGLSEKIRESCMTTVPQKQAGKAMQDITKEMQGQFSLFPVA